MAFDLYSSEQAWTLVMRMKIICRGRSIVCKYNTLKYSEIQYGDGVGNTTEDRYQQMNPHNVLYHGKRAVNKGGRSV